jgi:hypothetical protein
LRPLYFSKELGREKALAAELQQKLFSDLEKLKFLEVKSF